MGRRELTNNECDKNGDNEAHLCEDEDVESEIVALANAIIHPGAMMVESVHAPIAVHAVAGAGRADQATVWTDAHWVQSVEQRHKIHLFVFLKIPRVAEDDAKTKGAT